jgi:hypothetical protein
MSVFFSFASAVEFSLALSLEFALSSILAFSSFFGCGGGNLNIASISFFARFILLIT